MNFKRMLRDFKANYIKNISFILLIILSTMIIIGFNRSSTSYVAAVDRFYHNAHAEDGQFTIAGKFSAKQIRTLEGRFHLTLEEVPFTDIKIKTLPSEPILRIFSTDRSINQVALLAGNFPTSSEQILIDSKFAEALGYQIGDSITLSGSSFVISGYGISPDYVYTLKNTSDFMSMSNSFGVAYLLPTGYERIKLSSISTTTLYTYKANTKDINAFKNELQRKYALVSFLERKDNSRLTTVYSDASAPSLIALIMGVLLLSIIGFIISISIRHTIQSESQIIGILYAQGMNANELLAYYLMLPSFLVVIGSIIGYFLGIAISSPLLILQTSQYTVPNVILLSPWYLVVIGIVLPVFLTLSITFVCVSKALGQTPLSLLRGSHSNMKVSKLECLFSFKGFSFFKRFRLKSMLRELGSILALFLGATLSMFILFTGLYMKDSCVSYMNSLPKAIPYENLYTFKQPQDLYQYSKAGELTSLYTVKFNHKGTNKNLYLQGIHPQSTFFNISVLESLQSHEVLISPSVHFKFGIQVGDTLLLYDDQDKNKTYEVIVKGLAPYDYGLYLYTTQASYNHFLGIHQDSSNALMTDAPITIKDTKLLSETNKHKMVEGMKNFTTLIVVFTSIIIVVASIILIVVIYMLMKMTIDKSKINISMVKIFGYYPKEVSSLYLKGNYFFLLVGYLLAIPASYYLTRTFFDSIFESMEQYILPSLTPFSYMLGFALMTLSYGITVILLKNNLNQISLTEALKNRE